ncbi:MAG: YHS domain-containing protein [Candidatus Brocadiales bacterium]|nr:YHS domain-containing protein [Candidatus Brocadiales bacterium]
MKPLISLLVLSAFVGLVFALGTASNPAGAIDLPTIEVPKAQVFDPVCGAVIDKEKALSLEYEGKTFYFCCDHCKADFEKEPEQFACACPRDCKDCPYAMGRAHRCGCARHGHHHGEHHHHHGEHE